MHNIRIGDEHGSMVLKSKLSTLKSDNRKCVLSHDALITLNFLFLVLSSNGNTPVSSDDMTRSHNSWLPSLPSHLMVTGKMH